MTAEDIKLDKHLETGMSVELDNFKNEKFILLNHENDTGKRAEKLFKKYELEPKTIFHLDHQIMLISI